MRNKAEKQRRDKLNTCIAELSQLVPLISNSSKKIEKTSVLRLSAAYLRLSRREYNYIIIVVLIILSREIYLYFFSKLIIISILLLLYLFICFSFKY